MSEERMVIRLEGKLGRVVRYRDKYFAIFHIGVESQERKAVRLEVNETDFERYREKLKENGKEMGVFGRLEVYL